MSGLSFDELLGQHYGPEWTGDRVLGELSKSLSSGTPSAVSGMGDAGPLRLLNLDATMTSVLFQAEHLRLFNWLARIPSPTGFYEWNRRTRYGSSRGGFAFTEGGAPAGSTSAFSRQGAYVKFMGVRRGITHQAAMTSQLGGTQVDLVDEEHRDGTMELLEKIERHLLYGDANITDQNGASVNYHGILNGIATYGQSAGTAGVTTGVVPAAYATQFIDKQGAPMALEDFEESAFSLRQNGKLTSFANVKAFMNPFVMSDLSKLKLQAERKDFGGGPYMSGVPYEGYKSNFGVIPFEDSIFFEAVDGNAPRGAAWGTTADPGAPTNGSSLAVAAPVTDTTSYMPKGGMYYVLAAFNGSGECAGSTAVLGTTTVAGNGSTAGQNLPVTWNASVDASVWGYRLYRGTKSDGSDARWIATLPRTATAYTDRNFSVPGTGLVTILERSPENLALAQMTPLIKFPLAVTSTNIEFLLLLYHLLAVKAPERMIVYRNVGRLS